MNAADLRDLPLHEIAAIIRMDWTKLSPYAKPYLDAMATMRSANEDYGLDSGKSIVLYFLSNATGWRGETARTIKAELKRRVS